MNQTSLIKEISSIAFYINKFSNQLNTIIEEINKVQGSDKN